MASTRLEILKSMVEQNPRDAFSRYGLAMEYFSAGDLAAAAEAFGALAALDPAYVATYYQYGLTLEKLGRAEDARQAYEAGLKAAAQKGNSHAAKELQAALDHLR